MKNKDSNYYILFMLLLFSCFQNLSIINFEGFSFKISHLIAIVSLLPLIKTKKIKLPPLKILLFIIFVLVLSICLYFKYGFNSLFFNYLFGLYYIILIINIGSNLNKEDILEMIQKVATIVMFLTIIKILLNINVFITFFKNPANHPEIECFFGGGVNLEATWVSMLGFSFYKNKKGYLYLIFSTMVSILYASRVGIITCVLLGIYFVFENVNKLNRKTFHKIAFLLIIMLLGFFGLYRIGMLDYIIRRFSTIGNEPGSMGRLDMWQYAIRTFYNNPIGYGIGNSLEGIKIVTGHTYNVGNIHNMFLQMLLDAGLFGFIYYCWINISFIVKNRKLLFKDSIVSFIFTYIVLSLFQFRGGDSLLFIMIGFYLLCEKNRKKGGKEYA